MTDFHGNERDARYLAQQLQTNGQIIRFRNRMQTARDRLHDIRVELEFKDSGRPHGGRASRPVVEIPVPGLDRSDSTVPSARAVSGTRVPSVRDMPAVAAVGGGDTAAALLPRVASNASVSAFPGVYALKPGG